MTYAKRRTRQWTSLPRTFQVLQCNRDGIDPCLRIHYRGAKRKGNGHTGVVDGESGTDVRKEGL
jgi:hypothetical protein